MLCDRCFTCLQMSKLAAERRAATAERKKRQRAARPSADTSSPNDQPACSNSHSTKRARKTQRALTSNIAMKSAPTSQVHCGAMEGRDSQTDSSFPEDDSDSDLGSQSDSTDEESRVVDVTYAHPLIGAFVHLKAAQHIEDRLSRRKRKHKTRSRKQRAPRKLVVVPPKSPSTQGTSSWPRFRPYVSNIIRPVETPSLCNATSVATSPGSRQPPQGVDDDMTVVFGHNCYIGDDSSYYCVAPSTNSTKVRTCIETMTDLLRHDFSS